MYVIHHWMSIGGGVWLGVCNTSLDEHWGGGVWLGVCNTSLDEHWGCLVRCM